jgi:hypothetical protein
VTRYGARPSSYRPTTIGASSALDIVLPPPAPFSDLSRWCQPEQQGIAEKCTGEALGGGLWLASRNTGRRPSAKGLWTNGREREKVRTGDPLLNVGVDPADVVDGAVLTGTYAEDQAEDDDATLNSPETFVEMGACVRIDPNFFVDVEPGDLDTLDRYLSITDSTGAPAGYGFAFAMQVDVSYEQFTGSGVWAGPTGPSLGGHMQLGCGHDITGGWYLVCGSWGPGLGQGGFVKISRQFIQQSASNLYVVRGSPIW